MRLLVHGLKNRSTAKKYAYTIGNIMNNFINTDSYDDHSFNAKFKRLIMGNNCKVKSINPLTSRKFANQEASYNFHMLCIKLLYKKYYDCQILSITKLLYHLRSDWYSNHKYSITNNYYNY